MILYLVFEYFNLKIKSNYNIYYKTIDKMGKIPAYALRRIKKNFEEIYSIEIQQKIIKHTLLFDIERLVKKID